MPRQWWEEENPKSEMYDVYSETEEEPSPMLTNDIETARAAKKEGRRVGFISDEDEGIVRNREGFDQVTQTDRMPQRPSDDELNINDLWMKHQPDVKRIYDEAFKGGIEEYKSNFGNPDIALMKPQQINALKEKGMAYAKGKADKEVSDYRKVFWETVKSQQATKAAEKKFMQERGGISEIGKIGTTPPGEKNESALEGMNEGQAAIVKKLTNYEIDLPSGMALRTPYWQAILERASVYDTSFSAEQYKTRLALKKDFTSGNGAKNIRSLNTAVQHLDTLTKAMKQLDNAPIQLWNKATNVGLTAIGDPRVTKFNTAATALSGELANVFKNTSGTDQEIQEWRKNLNTSDSPEQLLANINTVIELLGGRIGALQNQWEKGLGKPKDFNFLSNKSRDILKAIGVDTDKLDPIGGQTKDSSQSGSEQSGNIITYYDNGKRYNIPSDKESAFLKSRPNAKRGK